MRTRYKGGIAGVLFGVLVWLYDYDFLLNAGGPTTPISDAIVRMFFSPPQTIDPSGLEVILPSPFFSLVVLILFFGATFYAIVSN